MKLLEGKVAVVTGAARGIGKVVRIQLAQFNNTLGSVLALILGCFLFIQLSNQLNALH